MQIPTSDPCSGFVLKTKSLDVVVTVSGNKGQSQGNLTSSQESRSLRHITTPYHEDHKFIRLHSSILPTTDGMNTQAYGDLFLNILRIYANPPNALL